MVGTVRIPDRRISEAGESRNSRNLRSEDIREAVNVVNSNTSRQVDRMITYVLFCKYICYKKRR